MQISQNQLNVNEQLLQNKRIKLEILDNDLKVIDSIDGYIVDGTIRADATSTIRRSGNITLCIPQTIQSNNFLNELDGISISVNGKIWIDKLIKIYEGIDDLSTGETVWNSLGVFLIDSPTKNISQIDYSISFNCIDQMARLTGDRQGQLTGIGTTINKGELKSGIEFKNKSLVKYQQYSMGSNDSDYNSVLNHYAVAINGEPYFLIYDASNNFTLLENPTALPTLNGQVIKYSPNGNLLIVGCHGSSGNVLELCVYDTSTIPYTLINRINPLINLSYNDFVLNGLSFNNSGSRLVLWGSGYESLIIYNVIGNSISFSRVSIAPKTFLDTSSGVFSADDNFFITLTSDTDYPIVVYNTSNFAVSSNTINYPFNFYLGKGRLCVDNSNNRLYICGDNKLILSYDMNTTPFKIYSQSIEPLNIRLLTSVSLFNDKYLLLTSGYSSDNSFSVFDISTYPYKQVSSELIKGLEGSYVNNIIFSTNKAILSTQETQLFINYDYIESSSIYVNTLTLDVLNTIIKDLTPIKQYTIYDIPDDYKYLPYDIQVSTSGTVWDLLKEFNDILSTWQFYFDIDGIFRIEPIPSGETKPTIPLPYKRYVSNSLSYNLNNVKNQVIVYGKPNTLNYYTETYPIQSSYIRGDNVSPIAKNITNMAIIGDYIYCNESDKKIIMANASTLQFEDVIITEYPAKKIINVGSKLYFIQGNKLGIYDTQQGSIKYSIDIAPTSVDISIIHFLGGNIYCGYGSSITIYNPITNSINNTISTSLTGGIYSMIGVGSLLYCAGNSEFGVLNTNTNSFSLLNNLRDGYYISIAYANGKICSLVFNSGLEMEFSVYDISTNTYSTSVQPQDVSNLTKLLGIGDKIYCCGANGLLLVYDTSTNSFESPISTTTTSNISSMIYLKNKLYLGAGRNFIIINLETNTVEQIDNAYIQFDKDWLVNSNDWKYVGTSNSPINNANYLLAYGNGKFVGVQSSRITDIENYPIISDDGIIWEINPSQTFTDTFSSICYGNNKFVATCGSGFVNRYYSSTDGTSWEMKTFPSYYKVTSIIYRNKRFVALCFSLDTNQFIGTYTSSDGINWSTNLFSESYANLIGIVFDGKEFVIIDNNMQTCLKSFDGENWTKYSISGALNNQYSFAYGNNVFVTVGDNGIGYRSFDCIDWEEITLPKYNNINQNYRYITFLNGSFIATGILYIIISKDGINWTSYNTGSNSSSIQSITASPSIFVGFWMNNQTAVASYGMSASKSLIIPSSYYSYLIKSEGSYYDKLYNWNETDLVYTEISNNIVMDYANRTLKLYYDAVELSALGVKSSIFGFLNIFENSPQIDNIEIYVNNNLLLSGPIVGFENSTQNIPEGSLEYDTIYCIRILDAFLNEDSTIDNSQPITFELYSKQQPEFCLVNDNKASPFYINSNLVSPNYYSSIASTQEGNNIGTNYELILNNENPLLELENGAIITFMANYSNRYANGVNYTGITVKDSTGNLLVKNIPLVETKFTTYLDNITRKPLEEGKIYNDYTIHMIQYDASNNYFVYLGRNPKTLTKVCSGGEYDNIHSDQLAYERCLYELYYHSNMQDAISLEIVPNYVIDVNQRIAYNTKSELPLTSVNDEINNNTYYFITKQITYPLGISGNGTITANRIYDSDNLLPD